MKPFVFKTSHNNFYLYSPSSRKILPIPEDTYNAFTLKKYDSIIEYFERKGYLEEIKADYTKRLTGKDIEVALANIPQLVFEVTTQCNYKCKYCCYGENYETFAFRKDGVLAFSSAKSLLDKISSLTHSKYFTSYNSPLVLSFYGGEPLLNFPLIQRIVEYAKSVSFKDRILRFSLTTNASLLAKHIDFLKENNFALLVSLDGNKETNSYRVFPNGKSTYDTIMSNLKKVQSKYPEYFKTIRFNSVFTNLSDTKDIFSFFYSHFDKGPTLSPLHFSDGEMEKEGLSNMRNSIFNTDFDLYNKYPDSFLEIPIHKKIIHLLMYMTDTLYYDESSYLFKNSHDCFPTHTCVPFTKRLFLSVDNKIIPCEKVNRQKSLCEFKDGIFDFNYDTIAEEFNEMVYKYAHICPYCAFEMMCNHCACTSLNKQECPKFQPSEKISKIFSDVFSYLENNPKALNLIFENVILK